MRKFLIIAASLGLALITSQASAAYIPTGDNPLHPSHSVATSEQPVRVAGGCWHPKRAPYGYSDCFEVRRYRFNHRRAVVPREYCEVIKRTTRNRMTGRVVHVEFETVCNPS